MKHLRVEINGIELVNGDFAEISFTDGANGVKIEGKPARSASTGGGGGLLEMLAGASRQRTTEVTKDMRNSIADQPVVVTEPEPTVEMVDAIIEPEPVEQH